MELKEFQGLALRTESQISGIKLNRDNLITILKLVVEVAEILDAIKKATFYNKTAKLESDFASRLYTIAKLVETLTWLSTGRGPMGTMLDKNESISNVDPRVFHGIIGIITESGELAAALLKSVEDPDHKIDAVNIQEEMSDIAWYKAILHDKLGLDWGQGLENVINKLRIRYPEKYSDEAADNRNLEAERSALEVGVSTPPLLRNNGETFKMKVVNAEDTIKRLKDKDECKDHRIFQVNIPEGTEPEQLEAILADLRARVRYVDTHRVD